MEFWIFAYGSLMWRPNFDYAEAWPALLEGAHRALCVYSTIHRGTPWSPGLVLGLDKGGHCRGMAFRVPAVLATDTRLYLRRRENIANTYEEAIRPVKLLNGPGRAIPALCFMARRRHPQYAGALRLEKQAWLVRRAVGASGANLDYVMSTAAHLRKLGVYDEKLERLMTLLGYGANRHACAAG